MDQLEVWKNWKKRYPTEIDPKECKVFSKKLDKTIWVVGIKHKLHKDNVRFGYLFFCPDCEKSFPEQIVTQRIQLELVLNKYKV